MLVLLLSLILLTGLSSTGWVVWQTARGQNLSPLLALAYWASRSGVEAALARWRQSLAIAIPAWQHLQLPPAPLTETQNQLAQLALNFCGLSNPISSLASLHDTPPGWRGLSSSDLEQGWLCKRGSHPPPAEPYALFQHYLPTGQQQPSSFWESLLGSQLLEQSVWEGPPRVTFTNRQGMAASGVRANASGTTFHWMLGPQPMESVGQAESASHLTAQHKRLQRFRPLELRLSALVPSGLVLAAARLGWETGKPIPLDRESLLAGHIYLNEYLGLAPNNDGSPGSPWFGGMVSSAGCTQAWPQGCGPQQAGIMVYTDPSQPGQLLTPGPRQVWCNLSICPEFTAGPPHLQAQPLPLPNPIDRFLGQVTPQGLVLGNGPAPGQQGQVLALELTLQALTTDFQAPGPGQWQANPGQWQAGQLTVQSVEATTHRLWRNDPQSGQLSYREKYQLRYNDQGLSEERRWIQPVAPTSQADLQADPDLAPLLEIPAWQPRPQTFSGLIWLDHPATMTATLAGGRRITGLTDGQGKRLDPSNPRTARPAVAPFARITVAARSGIRLLDDLTLAVPACQGFPQRESSGVTTFPCTSTTPNQLGLYLAQGSLELPPLVNPALMGLYLLPQGGLEQTQRCLQGTLHLMGSLLAGRLAPTAPGCPPPGLRLVHDPRLRQDPPPGLDWLAQPVWLPQLCLGPAPLEGSCTTPSPQEWLLPTHGRSQ